MSLTIEPTIFKNVRAKTETYGFRIYDEYGKFYCNTWEDIPKNDMDVLEKVAETDDPDIKAMLTHIEENQEGVDIGGNWYDWSEIQGII
jgi:hypothetical protein